jgi:hypothetical protein
MKAWHDLEGLAVKGNFLVVRTADTAIRPLLIWALLNSPLANAYVYCTATKRHIIHGDLMKLPIPSFNHESGRALLAVAESYMKSARESEATFMQSEATIDPVRRTLLELDAEVLKLYDLPPRLERQLLDLFTGVKRKGVGCDFRGYYPPGLTAYVPLHELISEEYARSTLGRFREAPRTVSPDVLAALRTAADAYGEE